MIKIKALLAKMLEKINANAEDISARVQQVSKTVSASGGRVTYTFPSGAAHGLLYLGCPSNNGRALYLISHNASSGAVTVTTVQAPGSSSVTVTGDTHTLTIANGISSAIYASYLVTYGRVPT